MDDIDMMLLETLHLNFKNILEENANMNADRAEEVCRFFKAIPYIEETIQEGKRYD